MQSPLNQTLQALADPTRRAIIKLLGDGDLAAGEIAARFSISAPSISHHLNVLKGAGLVQSERQGQSIVYSLDATVVQEFVAELLQFLNVGKENSRAAEEDRYA